MPYVGMAVGGLKVMTWHARSRPKTGGDASVADVAMLPEPEDAAITPR